MSDAFVDLLLDVGRHVLIIVGILVVVIVFVSLLDRHKRPSDNAERDKTAAEFSKGESSDDDD